MEESVDTLKLKSELHLSNIVDMIFEGNFTKSELSQKVYKLFLTEASLITDWGHSTEKTSTLNFCKRIKIVKNVFDSKQLQALLNDADYDHLQKSSEISSLLRMKGNELYKEKKVTPALRAYTLAAMYSPSSNDELALAFANRSAILLQTDKPKEALEDIQKSLALLKEKSSDDILQIKLKERAKKCTSRIQQTCRGDGNKGDEWVTKIEENFFRISQPNEKIPNAEHFVKIGYTPEKGRHLIVNEDVPAGTVLLVDQPFVSVLNKILQWEVEHCNYCYRRICNGIPCKKCVFAIFCNEECKNLACSSSSGMHKFEDLYLPLLHLMDVSHKDIQSLRILATVGPSTLIKMWKTKDKSYFKENAVPGVDKHGVYNSQSYLSIFHLIAHSLEGVAGEEGTSPENLNVFYALFLKHILQTYSQFFKEADAEISSCQERDQFEDFVASLILKHLEGIKYNAISVSKLTENGKKSEAFATAVYPLISLCNHSCDPNCAPVKQLVNLKTSLISLKSLKKGDELFITYKPLYSQMKTSERQNFLANRYKFICDCQACEENWEPGSVEIFSADKPLVLKPTVCKFCSTENENSVGQNEKQRQCHACKLKDVNKAKKVHEIEQILFDCNLEMVEKFNYIEQLGKLRQILDYFGKNQFPSYFSLYFIALDLFKRTLVHCVSDL